MNTLRQLIGHFHPVLVHLPIGILLLALLFEVLSRRERYQMLRPGVPFALLLGAVAAAFSCLTGWLLSKSGDYESDLVNRHQWLGIGVMIVSFSAYWLKRKDYTVAYPITAVVLLPGILLTGHWGISLTHGSDYLYAAPAEAASDAAPVFADIPEVEISPASAESIAALRKTGVIVLPVGQDQPFLSLNFVNIPVVTPAIRQTMELVHEQVVWLKLSGTTLNDSTLSQISGFENLTRLSLDRTNVSDSSLVYLLPLKRLVHLNLVGTKVTASGVERLVQLPALQKLFLYQTEVTSDETALLQTKLPLVQIDMGGYQVPMLPTDTTMLKEKK